jgi:hypothetical protein
MRARRVMGTGEPAAAPAGGLTTARRPPGNETPTSQRALERFDAHPRALSFREASYRMVELEAVVISLGP